jgi:hypothetical protein
MKDKDALGRIVPFLAGQESVKIRAAARMGVEYTLQVGERDRDVFHTTNVPRAIRTMSRPQATQGAAKVVTTAVLPAARWTLRRLVSPTACEGYPRVVFARAGPHAGWHPARLTPRAHHQ